MARKAKPAGAAPPTDWTPTQAVDEPVLNSPYEEPSEHWVYLDGVPSKAPGRRPASYWYRTEKLAGGQADLFAEEERDDLPLVNRLRADVERWRNSGYRGASKVTRDLLAHWSRRDLPRPLFFCQRESAETMIYLLELALPGRLSATGFRLFQVGQDEIQKLLRGERPDFEELAETRSVEDYFPRLVDIPSELDLLPLRRLGCKMATGSGKTVIMAMLIAWAFCNRGRNPSTRTFPNGVLVCAPNLTVRSRLAVLKTSHPQNFYDQFDIVPAKYREWLNAGKVFITNWHAFLPKSPHSEGGTSYKVVDKGDETADAFSIDRLGDLASRMPLLVLNDEGHHCWRPAPDKSAKKAAKDAEKGLTKEEKDALKEELEEARVWLAGLDKINNSGLIGDEQPGILSCVDLSATPFYLANSGYPEGSPFPWLVSDFGLVDAIECGIVKVPRLPVRDDTSAKDDAGRPDPRYYRLWEHIKDDLQPTDRLANRRPKPDAVYRLGEGALITLAEQWKQTFDEIQEKSIGEVPVPPVLIVVCDNTEISQVFFQKLSGEKTVKIPKEGGKGTTDKVVYEGSAVLPEFSNSEGVQRTVRIDSKLLAKIEAEGGQTKDEAAQALRDIIDSVGKRGGPGEQVRCVVSVSMLTEGWDATNVTHVLGVRAFLSQLLCEQVVGRGLRRMNYTPDPVTGLLPAEYVDVYGIPFSLIPFKKVPTEVDPEPRVHHHIHAVTERSNFEIRIPVVESYTYALRSAGIQCDVDSLEGLIVKEEPTAVYLAPTRGYFEESGAVVAGDFVKQDRSEYYKRIRFQQILFKLSQMIVDDLIQGVEGDEDDKVKAALYARHTLFPEITRILAEFIDKKVEFAPGVDKKEIGLEIYAQRLRERVRDGILPAAASKEAPLLPVVNSYKPYVTTAEVNYRTTRPVIPLTKSHLNLAMIQSDFERISIETLEEAHSIECYTPNDRNVGLQVPYEYGGSTHNYEPDFVVRFRDGKLLMLEIKGEGGKIHDEDKVNAKNAAAGKWVSAVNNAKRLGEWEFKICEVKKGENLAAALKKVLQGAAGDQPVLPFRTVTPSEHDPYRNCVPLTSLRAAAGYWSEEQASLEPARFAEDWVQFETDTTFEDGMFIAQVLGRSMEPKIPDGAYCLFRPIRAGSRDGRILLVWSSGIEDLHSGGQFTVKKYRSEKGSAENDEWQHKQIVLEPLNPEYQPIILRPENEGEVGVVAEFVEVVGGSTET